MAYKHFKHNDILYTFYENSGTTSIGWFNQGIYWKYDKFIIGGQSVNGFKEFDIYETYLKIVDDKNPNLFYLFIGEVALKAMPKPIEKELNTMFDAQINYERSKLIEVPKPHDKQEILNYFTQKLEKIGALGGLN